MQKRENHFKQYLLCCISFIAVFITPTINVLAQQSQLTMQFLQGGYNDATVAGDDAMVCVGSFGTIDRLLSDRKTVQHIPSVSNHALFAIDKFPDNPSTLVAVGTGGIVVISTNNGINWNIKREPLEKEQILYSVRALKNGRIIACGTNGVILRSENNGTSFQKITTPITSTLNNINFGSDSLGVTVGHNGTVLITHDGGLSWKTQDLNTTNVITNAIFLSPKHCRIIVSLFPTFSSTTIWESTDGCESWDVLKQYVGGSAFMPNASYSDSLLTVFGTSGSLYLYPNSTFTTLTRQSTSDSKVLHTPSSILRHKDTLFSVGYQGTILVQKIGDTLWSIIQTQSKDVPTTSNLNKRLNNGTWIGSDLHGRIFRSRDMRLWQLDTISPLLGSYSFDSKGDSIFGVNKDGLMWRTSNDGKKWEYSESDDRNIIYFGNKPMNNCQGILYLNDGSILIYGGIDGRTSSSVIVKSSDYGNTFRDVLKINKETAVTRYFSSIIKDGSNAVYATEILYDTIPNKSATVLWKSLDNGETWSEVFKLLQHKFDNEILGRLLFKDGVFYTSTSLAIYKSSDGIEWTKICTQPKDSTISSATALKNGTILGILNNGSIIASNNYGASWKKYPLVRADNWSDTSITAPFFLEDSDDEANVYISFYSKNDELSKFYIASIPKERINSVLTSVESDIEILTFNPYLYVQQAPNPSNGAGAIQVYGLYSVKGMNLNLEIYDMYGTLKADLSNELNAVNNNAYVDIPLTQLTLPSGVYFARVRAGSFERAGKFVIQR